MSFQNKCRVCLVEGANLEIFEEIESKESIHSKLFQCFKEKIEDIEGYPRKLCEECNNLLNATYNFIIRYHRSCKVLESGLIVVKEETFSGNEMEVEFLDAEHELNICKNEPDSDSDGLEPLDDFWGSNPLPKIKKEDKTLAKVKAKLKNLQDINFRKKTNKKSICKTKTVASSILEAEFDWNGESLNSSKLKKSKEEKLKVQHKDTKLVLPKPAKGPPEPRLCDICGEVFKNPDRLSAHKTAKHKKVPVKCPKCPKTLTSQYYFKRHMKRSHDKTNSVICDTCGRGFAFKGELSKHIKIVHLKIKRPYKRFACNICKKDFITAKQLIIHERSAHTGMRPAECKVCGASFFHEDYLKEHMRLHTGETPFKCPICNRGYAQRGNMKSHVSHNHRLADLSDEQIKNLKPSWIKHLKKT